MSKDFLFVAGDIGAARMQAPVIRMIRAYGHRVSVFADVRGAAGSGFEQEGITYISVDDPSGIESVVRGHHLTIIGTSASATRVEWAAWNVSGGRKVLASDGYFNHGLKPWRDIRKGAWLAIDEGHAHMIRERRPDLETSGVRVTGQPAFDAALALEPRKREIRARVRAALGITDDQKLWLWWSQGMPRVIKEDFLFLCEALNHPHQSDGHSVLIPRFHPKLEVLRPGYASLAFLDILGRAVPNGFVVMEARSTPGEELCLAADVILSITCTEDIKSTLIGGPPVVHFMGPQVRAWFESDLGLQPPYLPDLKSGLAEAALTVGEVSGAIGRALKKEPLRKIDAASLKPATERVVEALMDSAS